MPNNYVFKKWGDPNLYDLETLVLLGMALANSELTRELLENDSHLPASVLVYELSRKDILGEPGGEHQFDRWNNEAVLGNQRRISDVLKFLDTHKEALIQLRKDFHDEFPNYSDCGFVIEEIVSLLEAARIIALRRP